MKKSAIVFLSILLISSIFLISLVPEAKADEYAPPMPTLPGNITPDNLEKYSNTITNLNSENSTDYLKKEWGKIISKNQYIGPAYNTYIDKIAPYTDPIFIAILGLAPALSWLFITTLEIWITVLIFIYRLSDTFPIFSDSTKYIIFAGVAIVFSVTYLSKKAATAIVNGIEKFSSTWWMQLIAVIIVIIIFFTLAILSKAIKQYIQQIAEKRKKDEDEEHRREMQEELKLAKEYSEKALAQRKSRMGPDIGF